MRVEDLERELRAERPEPDQEFTRKLDDWAAAGFPRGELDPRARGGGRAEGGFRASLRELREWLASTPPRRLVAPVAAAATLVVVAGVAITQSGDISGDGDGTVETTLTAPAPTVTGLSQQSESAAGAPQNDADAEAQTATPAPDVAAPAAPGGAGEFSPGGSGIAHGADGRLIDASARLSLGADADDVQEVANDVVAVTDRHDGIVVNSEVTTDQAGARASFELEIPFTELDATIADLSELGDVISRTEDTADVTPQANRAQRGLEKTLAQIRRAQEDLIAADTREEKLILRSQIDSLKAQARGFESQLNGVERQARFATVSVDVTSDGPAADDDGWGLDDAVDDAGDVLTAIAGVGLVSLAVLLPLTLVAAIVFWFVSRGRRARRESALDRE